ncbi:efflux RND transporter periplasmic adaptor subunit [Candidatus Nitrospira allomarina]|uniref:Efflux RND transporter periplasmic adaptor subunit n=1 Tax=Candidatus Nitrospira allomarina TaxID=3020900 RepID=A0AA96JRX6_9BACT|nr:efflux RND transporter periplasmic adaptor subunit [Candidatus Nitrospira allomarina]WNM57598.1 efflux RND transporter periplasmic adaptor subunit [Candidatus Nitrospira allomarina]
MLTHTSRKNWIILGLLLCMLVASLFFFKETWWPLFQSTGMTTNEARQTEQPMQDMNIMSGHSSMERESSQGYAMVTPARQQLIGVTTALVSMRPLQTVIRAVGKVDYDEQRLTHINLRISGWVEDLFVDSTGQLVQKGQPLFTLYSQELVSAQEEYLLAMKANQQIQNSPLLETRHQTAQMVQSARERLRHWTLTDAQIDELARRGKSQTYVTIYSPVAGYVIDKQVFKGTLVKPEMTLYAIADLSTVWVQAEVFEYEMPFVQVGQLGILTLAAYPGETFQGEITFIYPYLNQEARTNTVRLVFKNPKLRLKPDMYGTVQIQVNRGSKLVVPEEAVLDSGTRQVVYVLRGEGMFEPRPVTLGPKVGGYYEILEGLALDERIATSGTFLLDSESKLMASSNMMGALGMGGIKMEQANMGKMDMDMGADKAMTGPGMAPASKTPAGTRKKNAGDLTLSFSTNPSPARIGENRIQVTVSNQQGKPVSPAQVQLTFTMPMPGMSGM